MQVIVCSRRGVRAGPSNGCGLGLGRAWQPGRRWRRGGTSQSTAEGLNGGIEDRKSLCQPPPLRPRAACSVQQHCSVRHGPQARHWTTTAAGRWRASRPSDALGGLARLWPLKRFTSAAIAFSLLPHLCSSSAHTLPSSSLLPLSVASFPLRCWNCLRSRSPAVLPFRCVCPVPVLTIFILALARPRPARRLHRRGDALLRALSPCSRRKMRCDDACLVEQYRAVSSNEQCSAVQCVHARPPSAARRPSHCAAPCSARATLAHVMPSGQTLPTDRPPQILPSSSPRPLARSLSSCPVRAPSVLDPAFLSQSFRLVS
ncbi:hypothetical protein FB567DRAFT_69080 [Paraphoma chrysanthemicola]|uniref:Uncharacterized protein n=1 Tax=Paraphoma chrysanthemicola TaxID=798071 RepID=A0A8K0VXQ7_9PLEO|nr:hypothetical protein FB567DRAFT_69080 [Paraphoma chrysanthemicola]